MGGQESGQDSRVNLNVLIRTTLFRIYFDILDLYSTAFYKVRTSDNEIRNRKIL